MHVFRTDCINFKGCFNCRKKFIRLTVEKIKILIRIQIEIIEQKYTHILKNVKILKVRFYIVFYLHWIIAVQNYVNKNCYL